MEIFDGQIIQKTPSTANEDNQKNLFHSQDITKACFRQTPLVLVRRVSPQLAGEDTTLDSDDVVRKLILTPKPEFTVSLREPGPVNQVSP